MICKIWMALYVQPPLRQDLYSYEIRSAVATGKPNSPGDSRTWTRWAASGLIASAGSAGRRDEVGCGQRTGLRQIGLVMVLNVSGQSAGPLGPAWISLERPRVV